MAMLRYAPWRHGVLILLLLGILMARVPELWRTAQFVAEDGREFFAGAWNHPWYASLLMPYAGYFHLLPRLLAEGLSILPLAWQPTAYAATGLFLKAVLLSTIALPHFRKILPSDAWRFGLAVLLALAPNAENLGLLLGLHWYLAAGLGLTLVMQFPETRTGRLTLALYSVIAIWSSPSTLALTPFFLLYALHTGATAPRRWHVLVLINQVLVGLFIVLLRFRDAARTGEFQPGDLLPALDRLVLRGWMSGSLLGTGVSEWLAAHSPLVLSLLGAAAAILLFLGLYRCRRQPHARAAALLIGGALAMLGFSLTRTLYVNELASLALPRHDRYLTAPTLLFITGLGVLLFPLFRNRSPLFGGLLFCLYGTLLVSGVPFQKHWARPMEAFTFREFIPDIRAFDRENPSGREPASLYLPHDIPYDGIVLERSGGRLVLPEETPLPAALRATPGEEPATWHSWLGTFTTLADSNWIEHQRRGRLEYLGTWGGRTWFRDADGRLHFTSPLLAPRWWIVDGERFLLR